MTGYPGQAADGTAIWYEDRKRWLWLLSVTYPLQPFIGIALHAGTGQQAWLLLPLALTWIGGPLLDALVGEDENNPPDEVVMALERDTYYRVLTWVAVPMHFACFYGTAWWVGTQPLAWWAWTGLSVVAGMTAGLAINTGHELGHKRSRLERALSRLVLTVPAYGHFTIDHNRGHHRDVATPEDCASARMGESIYRFALREIPGAFRRAWSLESERLAARGLAAWHPGNRVLRSLALTAMVQGVVVVAFGWSMLGFLVIHNLCAWWQLTSANYVEHYGLLRMKDANGRYERCRPHHSWNSNHLVSNLSLFHLERHSDHHANPQRRYQSLRHFPTCRRCPRATSVPTSSRGCRRCGSG
ncbi:MAG: alkane 1-monooxygenase [Woeseiaceae bacterium]|nr:alkane 1-monooxygenase [Woeseiaceae bacterium]